MSYKLAFSPCLTEGAGAFLLRISKIVFRGNTAEVSMSTKVRKFGYKFNKELTKKIHSTASKEKKNFT